MLRRTLEMRHMYPVDGELRNSSQNERVRAALGAAIGCGASKTDTVDCELSTHPYSTAPGPPAGTRWVDARPPRERGGERWCVTRVCAEFHCATLISVPVNHWPSAR